MFDETKADKAVKFIEHLRHTKGRWAGQPFNLLDWQRTIIRDIFGTVRANGYRQYNQAYVECPKKNGKSELAAAVALKMLFADGEYGAEIYGAASDRDQAGLVFRVAASMVRNDPALSKRARIIDSSKWIMVPHTESFYHAVSSETAGKHGYNSHAVIFDELHAQPNRELWEVLTEGSGDARTQPLVFAITTAGSNRNSICFEQHDYALRVLKARQPDTYDWVPGAPIKDEGYYPVVYGLRDDEEWESEASWAKVNPSLGAILDIAKLREAYERAKSQPAKQNAFRRLRLNQWTRSDVRWLDMETWDQGGKPFDSTSLIGRPCYGGLDLSTSIDITAFVLVFPPTKEDDNYRLVSRFWIPADNIAERVKSDGVPFDVWARDGLVTATPGNVIDYASIEREIIDLGKAFKIQQLAYDRWGATQISQNLTYEGFDVVPFGQGFKSMSPPTKEFEVLLRQGKLLHGGNPVLRWMADNVMVNQDPAENLKPDKAKSTERIDGIVAAIMALDLALRGDTSESVYESGGIMML